MPIDRHDIDRLVTTYREDYTPDVEQGLSRLRDRITPAPRLHPRPHRSHHKVRRFFLPAAAAAAVVLLAVFLLRGDGRVHLVTYNQALAVHTLPDGSRVTLQSGSEVTYEEASFNQQDRAIELTGQAFFEVQPNPRKPFLVSNGRSQLRVTGTAFNLRSADTIMEVEVSEGSVILERGAERMNVGARECGLARVGKPILHKPAPNLNHHAWRTGELRFDHTPIQEVLSYFSDNWNIKCSWADGQACDYTVSGHYSGGDAGAVLADIAKLGGATLRSVEGDAKSYVLSGPCSE